MADCVQCGHCCRVGICIYGLWDPKKKQCSYLTDDNLCGKYNTMKKLRGARLSPAFGTGCSSSLGNTHRQKAIAKAYGKK